MRNGSDASYLGCQGLAAKPTNAF